MDESVGYEDWCLAKKGDVYKSIFAQIKDYDNSSSKNGMSGDCLSGLSAYFSSVSQSPAKPYTYKNNIEFLSSMNKKRGATKNNLNITAMCIDTLTAKLASTRAVPQAVTFKGTASGRQLADDLNFILKGVFNEQNVFHKMVMAHKHAMINRIGYLKVVKDDEKLLVEPVYADEVVVDLVDGYYDKPYKIIQRKLIPQHILVLKYPEHKDKIKGCEVNEIVTYNSKAYTPGIMVAEAWCKNSYLKGGRHVICIDNCDLVDEEWDKDYFTLIKCDYNPPVIGYVGQSLVDELSPIQQEIDRILESIQSILRLVAVPRVFVDVNSNTNKNHITNRLASMVEYNSKTGVAPILHNGSALAPEIIQSLEFQVTQAYARVGLTDVDTQGQLPTGSGNTSGEALKTQTDIRSERWQFLKQLFEDKVVEIGQVILNELAGEKFKVTGLDRMIGLKEISTTIIPKTEGSYVLRMLPVSSLPKSIPDLMDTCEKMSGMGLISKAQLFELFEVPDVDSKVAILSAPSRLIDKVIDEMLDEGTYTNPEPYFDLVYASSVAIQQYSWAILNKIPEDRLALLRRFINDVRKLIAAIPPAPIPQTMPPPTKPTGMPQQ